METKVVKASEIDFSDSKLAFAHQSDHVLKKTFKVMKMVDSPFLTKVGPPLLKVAFALRLPVKGFVKKTVFEIFCGGETLEESMSKSVLLYKSGVKTILDYSVEGEKTNEGFDKTRDEIIRTLKQGGHQKSVAFSAMKATGIASIDLMTKVQAGKRLSAGEQKDFDLSFQRLEAICQAAYDNQQPLFIDAEESWIQNVIDTWAEEMMARYNKERSFIVTTAQMYRHDRLDYIRKLIERARAEGWKPGIKLVRGAYLEKENDRAEENGYPTPIQPNKAATDRDFDEAIKICIDHIDNVSMCAGTHNENSSKLLAELMEQKGIPENHPNILFAQLLGMSDNISFTLAHYGYNTAKYLPYGPVKSVLPYLIRRAQENTSIAGQMGREMSLLMREMKRRGLK